MFDKLHKKLFRASVFLTLVLFFSALIAPLPGYAATSATVYEANTVNGQAYRSNGSVYNYNIAIELRKIASGQATGGQLIDFSKNSRGKISFTDVPNGNYRIDIYFEKDLLNPGIDATPIYSDQITMNTYAVVLPNITLPIPTKCARGETFYFENGQGRCAVMSTHQQNFSAAELEERIFAMVNYYRRTKKQAPFQHDDQLKTMLKAHVADMANYNYVSLTDLDGCDTLCRLNANNILPSIPFAMALGYYTYDRIFKGGIPARYITPYSFANRIARKIKYKKLSEYDKFEAAVVIKNNRVYVHQAGMADFTIDEWGELVGIVTHLVSGVSSDREKIVKVHDWITENIAYDVKKRSMSYTGVGAFRNRLAVCEGYADLLRYMMAIANINADIVHGWAPQAHAWNMVSLDSQILYIDATWDAGYLYKRKFVSSPSDNYLLIPEDCIVIDHFTDKKSRVKNKQAYLSQNQEVFSAQCGGLYDKYAPNI